MIDTYYKSVKLLYYYGGTITYATPSSGTVSSAPTNLASTLTAGKVALTWSAPASNGGSAITSYNIYRGTSAGGESATAIGTSTSLAYTDSNVVAGTTYYYVVKAVNSVGTSAASNEASRSVPGTVPSAPTNLASTLSAGKVSLTWTAPASSGSSPVTGYVIYRGTSSALTDQVSIGSSITTSYLDTASLIGTYYYTVKAVSSVGSSPASASISMTVEVPSTVPGTVSGVNAVGSIGQVTLNWIAPSNGGSAITGYKLYRSTVSGSETLVATLGAVHTYADTGLINGGTYYYRISAVNAIGEGPLSSEVTVTVSALPSFISVPENELTVGSVYSYQALASGQGMTYYLSSNATFLSIDSGSGTISGTADMRHASYYVHITATGSSGAAWQNYTLFVNETMPQILTTDISSGSDRRGLLLPHRSIGK